MPTTDTTLDTTRVDDTRIAAVRALVSPAVMLEELPATPAIEALVVNMPAWPLAACCEAMTTAWWWWWGRAPSMIMIKPCSTRANSNRWRMNWRAS
jgi:hypothetical protein